VDVTAGLEAPCAPDELFAWVEDLSLYPDWLEIVPRAVAEDGASATWTVDLRGRLGPLARSKRLRMVRTVDRAPFTAMFERREDDGRSHAAWVLRAEIAVTADGSRLTMHMHYGGALWGPVIERLLGDEIGQSRTRLLACITGPGHPS